MHVDFMRRIDKYLGIPLCYLFSSLNLILKPFFKKKADIKVDKVLFIQISEMGSAVSAVPAILELKKRHPQADIYYLIFEEMAEILEVINLVKKENIFTIRSKSVLGFILSTCYIIWMLRRKTVDIVIDMELFSRFSSLLSYFISANRVIGFQRFHMEGLYRGNFHDKPVIYNHTKHIALNFLSCVTAIDAGWEETPLSKTRLKLNDIKLPLLPSFNGNTQDIFEKILAIEPAFNKNNKLVIINPNASLLLPLRKWPVDNYITLAKRLMEVDSISVILTGTRKERDEIQLIADAVDTGRCINLSGRTTVRDLMSLYSIAHVLVSNDSGPPNFAALTNIKIIVLFGPETPLCYAPLTRNIKVMYADLMCSPCVSAYNHRKSACNDNKCMKAIKVEDVFREVLISLK